jgi:hypothetical protein
MDKINSVLEEHYRECCTFPSEESKWQDQIDGAPRLGYVPYFYAVTAPSGAGKTQLGFTLARNPRWNVIHVALFPDPAEKVLQHPSLALPSRALRVALERDLAEKVDLNARICARDCDPPRGYGIESPLARFTANNVLSLLSQKFLGDSDCTMRGYRQKVFDMARVNTAENNTRSLPVLVVDACWPDSRNRVSEVEFVHCRKQMEFLRNLMTGVGIATIFLSDSMETVK